MGAGIERVGRRGCSTRHKESGRRTVKALVITGSSLGADLVARHDLYVSGEWRAESREQKKRAKSTNLGIEFINRIFY